MELWGFDRTTPSAAHLVYGSPGRVDQPGSCAVRCKDGYFRISASQRCTEHRNLTCLGGEYLRRGDHTRDAACLPCSGCAGRRRLASCNATADDVCADCGPLGAYQRWQDECVRACADGFQLNKLTQECDLCQTPSCPPGELPPRTRDNCTHCEACPPKPEHADWLTQNDRFDCTWECKPKHTLVGEQCVPWQNVFEDTLNLTRSSQVCSRGQTLVDFQCTDCFIAASKGAIRDSDLPSQDQTELWTWLAGCHWQCRHVLGYTALRSESGSSWQCVKDSRRSLVLRGPDDSWIAQAQQETQGPRRAVTTARTLVSYALLVLAAVPMLVLKCSLLMHCLRQCKRVDAV
jgi:hypothetical protein